MPHDKEEVHTTTKRYSAKVQKIFHSHNYQACRGGCFFSCTPMLETLAGLPFSKNIGNRFVGGN
jgi:hypothetical protein